ncbi:hypothetical protein Scep_001150 [Stephania cephalantha]|uniref:Uncharacterized protein n=1 Tax=Stephania cephalantha TaxID=152367 RepID=A0AAP0LBH7_9MAGN
MDAMKVFGKEANAWRRINKFCLCLTVLRFISNQQNFISRRIPPLIPTIYSSIESEVLSSFARSPDV